MTIDEQRSWLIDTLGPEQNGLYFADDTFDAFLLYWENWCNKISLILLPKQIAHKSTLVQVMVRRRTGDEPLPKQIMIQFMHHSVSWHFLFLQSTPLESLSHYWLSLWRSGCVSYGNRWFCFCWLVPIYTLTLRQNCRHFADDIFECIFCNENGWILLKISLKFVPGVRINNIPALVQIMAWCWSGDYSHYLNQWWLVYCRINTLLGLNRLKTGISQTIIEIRTWVDIHLKQCNVG